MKPSKQATWAGVAMLALTILSSYVSTKYERHRVAQESAPISISVETGSTEKHAHGAVISQNDIITLVERAIKKAVKARHEKDLILFKQKESWE